VFDPWCLREKLPVFHAPAVDSRHLIEYASLSSYARLGHCHRSATFNHYGDFESAAFRQNADFESAAFNENGDFNSANFDGYVDFESATFAGYADFDFATFGQAVNFRSVTFGDDANFTAPVDRAKATLRASCWERAGFRNDAIFENRIFIGAGEFEGATFHKAPRFHGCTLHQAVRFPTEDHFRDTRSPEAEQAYRTLKLAMAAMKARGGEGMFFTLEQRSLRNVAIDVYSHRLSSFRRDVMSRFTRRPRDSASDATETSSSQVRAPMRLHEITLSWLYDSLSEFGRNAVRRAWVVIALWAMASVAYAAIAGGPVDLRAPIDAQLLEHSAAFSLEQVLRPLYVWGSNAGTLYRDINVQIPLPVKLLASLQSVLSLALISLSLLALNWRFKRD